MQPAGTEDDAELCSRSARGDQAAFSELVRRHERHLRSFLRHLAGADVGDELAQEAFLKAWRNIRQYRSDAKFSSWLCGIGWRCFVDHHRKGQQELRKARAFFEDTREPQSESPDALLDVRRAVSRLSPDERAALILCEGHGWSHSEAARILAMPLGTLKSIVLRAKTKCRAALKETVDE